MIKIRSLLIIISSFVIVLTGCATSSQFFDKSTGISQNSTDVILGVRLYGGKLPPYIEYRSLGEVEGRGRSWEVVQQTFQARQDMALKAKALGANALINIKLSTVNRKIMYRGEAVIVKEYPDKFDESSLAVWSPVSYENSHIFHYAYESVFKAVENILRRELYDLELVNQEDGVIEAKEVEISSDRVKWTDADFGGPYPKLKIRVSIKKKDNNLTQVIETVIVRGSRKKKGLINKSSKIFFKEIADYLERNLS